MNVMMLTHRLPYAPNRGDRRRAYYILRFLSASHQVHLVSLVHDDDEASKAADMKDLVASVEVALASPLSRPFAASAALLRGAPLTHVLLDGPALRPAVERVAARVRPDVVLAYCSGLARFAMEPPLRGTPWVLDLVDVDSDKWRQFADGSGSPLSWVYRREAARLEAFEALASQSAAATLVVNERELTSLRAVAPAASGAIVPNGIDIGHLRSPRPPARGEGVLFCGVMSYRPNDEAARWFISEVWPLVRLSRPAASLCIAGTAPTSALRRLARRSEGVEVTGHVADVRPYYWDASVFVAPIRLGRGVQNKALDAAAAGLPSVVTSFVHEGLPRDVAPSSRVADDALSFAKAVVELLEKSPEERRAIAGQADLRAMSWSTRLAPLTGILEAAARRRI